MQSIFHFAAEENLTSQNKHDKEQQYHGPFFAEGGDDHFDLYLDPHNPGLTTGAERL